MGGPAGRRAFSARAHPSLERFRILVATAQAQSGSTETLPIVEPDRRAISLGPEELNSAVPSILLVATHPVQYSAPIFRMLAADPRAKIQVAYCSLEGSSSSNFDEGFGVNVQWDVPLLDGYPWIAMRNISPRPRVGSFLGLVNTQIWRLIASKQ